MQKNTPHLSERNLQTIYTVGRCKFLSSHQLKREFYPNTTHETATQRFTELARLGFLSREAAYPKAMTNPVRRPSYIYFFSSKNRENLEAYLTAHGKADRYAEFAVLQTIDKDDGNNFSNAHLVHESSIPELLFPLEKACAANPEWELLLWEITSPRSAEIPDKDIKVKVRDKRTRTTDGTPKEFMVDRHFNPDSIALLREPGNEFTFNVVEIDNNSNNPADMRAKYEAFIGYDNQNRFPKLIAFYARKYHLEIPDPEDIPVRYLTVSSNHDNDHKRRNQLFQWSLPYGRTKQLLFASITDCTPENVLTGNI